MSIVRLPPERLTDRVLRGLKGEFTLQFISHADGVSLALEFGLPARWHVIFSRINFGHLAWRFQWRQRGQSETGAISTTDWNRIADALVAKIPQRTALNLPEKQALAIINK